MLTGSTSRRRGHHTRSAIIMRAAGIFLHGTAIRTRASALTSLSTSKPTLIGRVRKSVSAGSSGIACAQLIGGGW